MLTAIPGGCVGVPRREIRRVVRPDGQVLVAAWDRFPLPGLVERAIQAVVRVGTAGRTVTFLRSRAGLHRKLRTRV